MNVMTNGVHPIPYKHLDPGVRDLVAALNAHGFRTTDSGDGVSKPPPGRVFDFPHVFMIVVPVYLIAESNRLQGLLCVLGCEGWTVEATYCPGKVGIIGLLDLRNRRKVTCGG